jgi:spore germination protein GerM
VKAGRGIAAGIAIVAAGVLLVFAMLVWLPRWTTRATTTGTVGAAAPAPVAPAAPGRKIKARLFYIAEDGLKLTSVERDVAYGEGPIEQAREIISAQIAPPVEPLVSAVPPGTALRAVFITEGGEAFIDLSRDVVSAHPGGTLGELLTVYTLVNALTENLPVVTAVQVLVDGKEVETLSGHIDLRRPLAKNLTWVE